MTRYIVFWHPGYESGMSRMETINTLKQAWATRAPQLVTRRKVEMRTTAVQELFDKINAWLLTNWGKSMPKRPLSIVTVTDPVWVDSEKTWHDSFEAMRAGYMIEGGKPQLCVLSHEGDLG